MSHETHNEAQGGEKTSKTSMRSSFWLVVILVFLFVAALNFIEVMSKSEGEEGAGKEKTEHPVEKQESATANQTMSGETGVGKPTENSGVKTAGDTTQKEAH